MFCEVSQPACATRNTDNRKVEIRTGGEYACTNSIACVHGLGRQNPELHIPNVVMRLEEPAWGLDMRGRYVRHIWTEETRLDRLETVGGQTMTHLKTVVMHEFGHVAGLADLYTQRTTGDGYVYPVRSYLMGDPRGVTSIPARDVRNIDQLYRNRHGGLRHN